MAIAPPAVVAETRPTDAPVPATPRPLSRAAAVDSGVVVVALLAATVLRVVHLGSVGVNSDEAVYAGQAASLAGNPHFTANFPIVRAHPLLFQLLASPFYRSGVPDLPGRYVSAALGVGTVALVLPLGRLLYGRRAGALAALLMAVTPYHVVVSRQALLDGPMTFFATAGLVCLAALGRTGRGRWTVAAGACLGLAALTKETAVILVGSGFAFLALVPRLWRPARHLVVGSTVALALTLTYPVVTALSGGSRSGQSYLVWQLTRRPNHDLGFYLTTVAGAMGWLLLAVALAGLVLLRHVSTWRELLLLSWVAVPLLFFEVWPVKGFSYLLVVLPAVVVLAARALVQLTERADLPVLVVGTVTGVVLVASLLVPTVRGITEPGTSGLAGAGGTPGGREAGRWVDRHLPEGSRLMTLGPSMANVLQYYSGRAADGLSVSPNPMHRNPTYQPIVNPDAALRTGDYQYVVWDAYSAERSPTFAAKELTLVRRYHGVVVHTERATFGGRPGSPVIVVYEVHP